MKVDYFKMSKCQSKDENPLYLSQIIYKVASRPLTIDHLCTKVIKKLETIQSPEFERTFLLSLCFMYGVNMIEDIDGKLVRK